MLKQTTTKFLQQGLVTPTVRLRSKLTSSKGRSLFWATADQFLVGGANLATILLIGKLAGSETLGVFYLCLTAYYLILSAQESLITNPFTVFAAGKQGRTQQFYAGAGLCQSLLLSTSIAAVLAIAGFACYFTGVYSELSAVLLAGASVLPLWLLREFGRRYLFAKMRVHETATISLTIALIQLPSLLLLAKYDILTAANALLVSGLASGTAIVSWLWMRRDEFLFSFRSLKRFTRKNVIFGRWLLASQGTAVLSSYAMPWLVVAWLGAAATGVFAACDAILRFANPMLIVLTNVLTPWVAIGHNEGGGVELRRIVKRATAVVSAFLIVFCLFLAIAGQQLLGVIGEEYAVHWITLLTLGVNQLVLKQALAPGRGLMVLDKPRLILIADAAGFVATVAAAFILIPLNGIFGAAIALVIGSSVKSLLTVVAYVQVMRKRYPSKPLQTTQEGAR